MVQRGHQWPKHIWKGRIWNKAWPLEDVFWCIGSRCHQSLALLNSVCSTSRYVIWWQLADVFTEQLHNCEIMVKLLCRSSWLKVDDVRLKSSPAAAKFCTPCDLSAFDDVYHMILQCPYTQRARNSMFTYLWQEMMFYQLCWGKNAGFSHRSNGRILASLSKTYC